MYTFPDMVLASNVTRIYFYWSTRDGRNVTAISLNQFEFLARNFHFSLAH
jgi:hypothetical protein